MKLLNKIKLKSRLTCLVKHKDKRLKPIKAFTLIELLVVIAIIGILASVVVVNVGSSQAKARDAKRVSDLKSVQIALELYYDKNSSYYKSGETCAGNWKDYTKRIFQELVDAGYLSQIPQDPKPVARGYFISCPDPNYYVLRTELENNNNPALSSSYKGYFHIDYARDQYYNTFCIDNPPVGSSRGYCISNKPN